ncbi:MAG: PAS domain-containing protein [Hymenobacteraceae bacterium]|nr:PAS domain-containing protein [Hymenobacteraceae bacterium]
MPAPVASPLPAYDALDPLLHTLLDINLAGVLLLRPLYERRGAETTEITDFALDYLNPAGQRMVGLPARPGGTLLGRFPHTRATGSFAYCQRAFASGEAEHFNLNYQHDGLDNFFRHAAKRCGEVLMVSFTDTADQPRGEVEIALRASQAAEQAARADVEAQRTELYGMLMEAPAMICIFAGPTHVFDLVNPPYQRLVDTRPLLGRTIREAMPELAGQPIFDLLDTVYRTGTPFVANEMLVQLDHGNVGAETLEKRYYNFVYQPRHDAHGAVNGILVFAYEMTPQVVARQQVQQLNDELETRVAARARELKQVQAEAIRQREQLALLFRQVPAMINTHTGPEHVYELVHPLTMHLFGNRALVGRPRREALPELDEATHAIFDRVYHTGEPYHGYEVLARLDRYNDGVLHDMYFDVTVQPLHDAADHIGGVMSFTVDVTERVLARRQAEALQADLLSATRRQVEERETFYQVFAETPASIAVLRGPEHQFLHCNHAYQQLFPGRALLGLTVAEALPEAAAQGFVTWLDAVYRTGETFLGTRFC